MFCISMVLQVEITDSAKCKLSVHALSEQGHVSVTNEVVPSNDASIYPSFTDKLESPTCSASVYLLLTNIWIDGGKHN